MPAESTGSTPIDTERLPDAVWQALVCSHCCGALERVGSALRCVNCDQVFGHAPTGALDLRLKGRKTFTLEFELGVELLNAPFDFSPLRPNPAPAVDFSRTKPPWHFTSELLTYFPMARSSTSVVLDLGCGSGLHKEVCEQAGFQWAGLDYANPRAPILGDGHALPFRSGSVEFVVSMAVLEHIRYPFVTTREVLRVLQPGGYYIGTVAFLEPFHGDSYYHHTHLGTYNSLSTAGFEVVRVAPNRRWSALQAQATMALFPRLPAPLSRALVSPLEALHRLWWWAGRRISPNATEQLRMLSTVGSFEFVARKKS